MATRDRPRRDVERNHQAILTAAIAVLADTPQVTMADIAQASGTGRSTLYRHFPDREALICAIFARIRGEAEEIVMRSLPGAPGDDPVEVLSGLCNALAAMAERYRFLEAHQGEFGFKQRPDRAGVIMTLLIGYVERHQALGEIRSDLPADWLVAMVAATVKQATARPASPERTRVVATTVTSLLRTGSA